MTAGGMLLGELARSLSQFVGRIVLDKTGLKERYDFQMTYAPEGRGFGPGPGPGGAEPPPVDPNHAVALHGAAGTARAQARVRARARSTSWSSIASNNQPRIEIACYDIVRTAAVIAFLIAILAFSPVLSATEHYGQVGFTGLAVPGATVTATQGDKQIVTTTDQSGVYRFADLADGTWTIKIEMRGFAPLTREVTVIAGAQAAVWELALLPFEEITQGAAAAGQSGGDRGSPGASHERNDSRAGRARHGHDRAGRSGISARGRDRAGTSACRRAAGSGAPPRRRPPSRRPTPTPPTTAFSSTAA